MSDAISKGGKVVVGGGRNKELGGLFYEPTVLTGVNGVSTRGDVWTSCSHCQI